MMCGVIFVSWGGRIQPIVVENITTYIHNPFEYWQVEIGIVLGSYDAQLYSDKIVLYQLINRYLIKKRRISLFQSKAMSNVNLQ